MSKKNKYDLAVINSQQPEKQPAEAGSVILYEGKVWERVYLPGLASAHLVKGAIPAGNPAFNYEGPQIPLGLWRQVLSYFKWANDTHHCEVQVRGFLNLDESRWKFWAFPQEKGGMSTKEIPGESADQQRAEIGRGWDEYMSAHSHCSAPAFQSGTDHTDEIGRPGLHVTIGKLNEKTFDLHARVSFIHGGQKVHYQKIDLTQWFEYPKFMLDSPREMWRALSEETILKLHEMGATSLPDGPVEFPRQWRDNLITKVWEPAGFQAGIRGGTQSSMGFYNGCSEKGLLEDLADVCLEFNLLPEELEEIMPIGESIKKAMVENSYWDWDKAANILSAAIISGEMDKIYQSAEDADIKSSANAATNNNGVPDFSKDGHPPGTGCSDL